MAFFIEIINGSEVGTRFRVGDGIRLGRSQGEILINDAKVSALHAQVEKDGHGQLLLVDLDSSNGLRLNGQRVRKIALLPGVTFQVGRTVFRVLELFKDQAPLPQDLSNPGAKDWRGVLKTQIPRANAQNHTSLIKTQPFSPALRLNFLQGIQADTSIVLGYGPRQIGADVLDIEIQDPESPDIAFELTPDDGGVVFSTQHPRQVLLNDLPISTDQIKEGDRIRIGGSLIEIVFEK
jgi:pSer/pThr/pTyr-binding forkhead associated (FHA) protein